MDVAVDHTAEWLTFVGALIVAFVAAVTAQWRQRGQLRHDREVRDLEELRALLDDCAIAIGAASQALLRWTNVLAHTSRDEAKQLNGGDEEPAAGERPARTIALDEDLTIEITDGDDADLEGRSSAFVAANEPVFALYQRVLLRLGDDHPVAEALADVQRAHLRYLAGTDDIDEKDPGTPERWEAVAAAQAHMRAAHFSFLEAGQRLVGSRRSRPVVRVKVRAQLPLGGGC